MVDGTDQEGNHPVVRAHSPAKTAMQPNDNSSSGTAGDDYTSKRWNIGASGGARP
ncbi:MAG: hypothetical protein HQL64_16815 [Magnetococcales bacterium]|nr:hypothetical protein [Magnetococcales bacterium]